MARTSKVLKIVLVVLAFSLPAAAQAATQTQQLSEPTIKWIFTFGIVCIAISWVMIPLIFAYKNKLEEMLDLLRRGTVIRFVTITYIVLVIVTLSLIGKLDGDKVATLLASIAGYVLGQATSPDRRGVSQGAPADAADSAAAGDKA